MMTHSLLRNLLSLLVISTGAATGQILDNFDNGNLYSNSTGTGSGFSSYGTVGVSESSGFAQNEHLRRLSDDGDQPVNDTVTPFGLGLSTAVFRFGSISLDSWQRLWVGYRHSNSTANHFYPYDYQTQGLYVSVNSGDGATSNRGNLVAVNEVGSRTTLATWNWADPYQLSNLVVTLRTTATNYELSFSGAAGGTPSFVSGAATGIITGLGTVGSRTFRMGVHNQYAGSSGGVRVDALEFSNVPAPEIAVEVDSATPVMRWRKHFVRCGGRRVQRESHIYDSKHGQCRSYRPHDLHQRPGCRGIRHHHRSDGTGERSGRHHDVYRGLYARRFRFQAGRLADCQQRSR